MLPALPQVKPGAYAQTLQPAQFLFPLQEAPNWGQRFWQRLLQLNNVKRSRSGLWQANLLGFTTTNNVLLSPMSGWEQGEILLFFSFTIQVAPAIPSPEKPGGWAACFPGSGEYKREHHGNPQSVHDTATEQNFFKSRNKIRTLL